MAGVMPTTASEANMKLLQQIVTAMAAPDADLEQLAAMQKQVLASIRAPYDTPSPGSAAAGPGAAMNLSTGATPPSPGAPAPGQLSPMLAAMMSNAGGGTPAGPPSLPPGSAQSGGLATRTPPNMDELRRILTVG
jgi:hypothetical protein